MYKNILIFTMILGFFHPQADSFQGNEYIEGNQGLQELILLFDAHKEALQANIQTDTQREAQRAFDEQMQKGIEQFFRGLDPHHFTELMNDELSSHPYLKDNGYEVLPENSRFTIPESNITIPLTLSAAALLSPPFMAVGSFGAFIFMIDGGFFNSRHEFNFTVLDRNQQQHPGSCLFYTAYDHFAGYGLYYEYDACYLRLITGWENAQVIPIPQTVDGYIRVGESPPFIGKFDDWTIGQTKVVGAGFIPIFSLD